MRGYLREVLALCEQMETAAHNEPLARVWARIREAATDGIALIDAEEAVPPAPPAPWQPGEVIPYGEEEAAPQERESLWSRVRRKIGV